MSRSIPRRQYSTVRRVTAFSGVQRIVAVDLFCGAGGLSEGLRQAGVEVAAGVDVDASCRYAYEANIGAPFVEKDVGDLRGEDLAAYWPAGSVRLLAGCAPCQPFSAYRRGKETSHEVQWPLLNEFGRLVRESMPEYVTMENVPRIGKTQVFLDFVSTLEELGYKVDWRSCYGPRYGLPQERRRLVLIASLHGVVRVPDGEIEPRDFRTVRDAIGALPPIQAGERSSEDPLHVSRNLSDLNLKRIVASRPGGTWEDWPVDLRSPCHQRATGASFRNVYARMSWDVPSPTITTLAYNFGAGRFGHPEQDRPMSLREAALLQGFPPGYRFFEHGQSFSLQGASRLIGNAVPPPLAKAIGDVLTTHYLQRSTMQEGLLA